MAGNPLDFKLEFPILRATFKPQKSSAAAKEGQNDELGKETSFQKRKKITCKRLRLEKNVQIK